MKSREDFAVIGSIQKDRRKYARKSMFVMASCTPVAKGDIHFYMSHPNKIAIEQIEEYSNIQRELNEASVDYCFNNSDPAFLHTSRFLSDLSRAFDSAIKQVLSSTMNLRRLPVNISLGGIFMPCAPSDVGFNEEGKFVGDAIFRSGEYVAVYIMPISQHAPPIVAEIFGKILRVTHVKNGMGIPDIYALGIEFQQPLNVIKPLLLPIIDDDYHGYDK